MNGMNAQISRMTLDDLPEVIEIDRVSFPSPWPMDAYAQELDNDKAFFFVARLTEPPHTLVGHGGMWMFYDEANISNIATHPDWRRRGVGELLVRHLVAQAQALSAILITLEVRASNAAAQRVYARLGFDEVGRRKRYYHDGEDAILMTKHLGIKNEPPGE